jgi:hypothetical protein
MSTFMDKVSLDGFSIRDVDTSGLDEIESLLPKNGVIDLNVAEQGLVITLHAQNICQENIVKIDRWIGYKEGEKNRAWSNAALVLAKEAGFKTVKDKEWFSQADEAYIEACNALTFAKAAKRWFENKASYFSGWHYAFKTFLKRDYSLERLGNMHVGAYNYSEERSPVGHSLDASEEDDMCGEIEWKD